MYLRLSLVVGVWLYDVGCVWLLHYPFGYFGLDFWFGGYLLLLSSLTTLDLATLVNHSATCIGITTVR